MLVRRFPDPWQVRTPTHAYTYGRSRERALACFKRHRCIHFSPRCIHFSPVLTPDIPFPPSFRQVYGNFNTPAASAPEAADPSSSSTSTQQPQQAQAPPPAVVESFELVDTYDGRPTPEAMRARVLAAAEARSPLDPRAAKRTRRG